MRNVKLSHFESSKEGASASLASSFMNLQSLSKFNTTRMFSQASEPEVFVPSILENKMTILNEVLSQTYFSFFLLSGVGSNIDLFDN